MIAQYVSIYAFLPEHFGNTFGDLLFLGVLLYIILMILTNSVTVHIWTTKETLSKERGDNSPYSNPYRPF